MMVKQRHLNRKQLFFIEMMACALLLVIAAAVMIPRFLEAQNFNTTEHFPDPAFRQEIEKLLQVKPGGYFSKGDVQQIKQIRLNNVQINNVAGIQYLTGLTHLDINSDELTEINLNSNVSLMYLRIVGRRLKHIIFNECKTVKRIQIHNTALESLDTSGNPDITEMFVSNNKLRSLDVTHHHNLRHLKCERNPLEVLDVSGLTQLLSINCSRTYLNEIDVSTNKALSGLFCFNTKMKSLDVSNNPNLSHLVGMNNAITVLDISQNPNLTELTMNNCQINALDTSQNLNLQNLNLLGNRLEKMPDFRKNKNLNRVRLDNNLLDCEDWEAFKQQGVTIRHFTFFPQRFNSIGRCAEDIELYQIQATQVK